jgi:hypothetical protein
MKVTSDMTLREKEIEAVDRFNKEIWGWAGKFYKIFKIAEKFQEILNQS